MPGVPGFPPGASWNARRFHKKPPAGAGGLRVECDPACHALPICTGDSHPVIRHGRRGGFHTRCPRVTTRGFLERASLPQKAPGGSLGTPGRMRSHVPCAAGLHRDIACRHPAWTAGWFSHPESPGYHPGLLGTRVASTKSPRREPGDSGSNAIPRAMRCRFAPGTHTQSSGMDGGVVFTPGVPGLPSGASWATHGPRLVCHG